MPSQILTNLKDNESLSVGIQGEYGVILEK